MLAWFIRAMGWLCPEIFKEPGTGSEMCTSGWYLVSDSGSLFSPEKFATAWAAYQHATDVSFLTTYGLRIIDIEIPRYHALSSEWTNQGACNVYNGAELKHFWQCNDPEYYNVVQREWRA